MRLVHTSDLHLGFRQYDRLTPDGINVRESDVMRSFDQVIAQTIALAPELLLVAGDVFHRAHPSNLAIVHAYRGLARLRAALPQIEVVVVAGNHDDPKSVEKGSILRLYAQLGVHVVDGPAQVLDFPHLDLSVLAVPDNQHERPVLRPSGGRRYNVLLLHGETGGIAHAWGKEDGIPTDALHAPEWDYIALGHYHVYHQVAPNAWYAGAIDYATTNAWGELAAEAAAGLAGKGIVERDLATGAHTFHPLPRSRVFVDLQPIDAHAMTPAQVTEAIALEVDLIEGGIDDKCIRLVINDLERPAIHALDQRMLRRYRRQALHFHLDPRAPARIRTASGVYDAIGRRRPLEQMLAESLRNHLLPPDIEREALVALGLQYLAEATDAAPAVMPTAEEKAAMLAFAQAELAQAADADPYAASIADAERASASRRSA
jgi:hypothetical protein